ncbi:hypothetical protein TNCV_1016981 [Trichonephila clavipes]|uniref:Uncharacterized protein n=1 Tax=Trichonephila clavipes TaxID=2585209 RepID=A0A8X6VXZ8_TRICX|nr:hypothetical protein TNCV_1016981 [Trichonephila clavipes]
MAQEPILAMLRQSTLLNVDLWSGREKKKRKIGMARKRAENREGSLGFPGGLGPYWRNSLVIVFHNLVLIPISYQSGSFAKRKKGDNRLVPDPDYMVDASKLPNQAPGVSGESLQTCVAWRCPDGTQRLFCCPILAISGQSLASNGPVVDSRDLNLVFGLTEATHNK